MSVDMGFRDPVRGPDPVVVPDEVIAAQRVIRPRKSWPVWVRLTFADGRQPRIEDGFAVAWTREHVLVTVRWRIEYYLGTREFWVRADQVKRRAIVPSRPRRDEAVHGVSRPGRGWRPTST